MRHATLIVTMLFTVLACKDESSTEPVDIAVSTPSVTFQPDDELVAMAESQSPVRISYRVIGTPIVGQPVALDLQFHSQLGAQGFEVSYRISDATALEFPESQPRQVSIAAPGDGQTAAQQVTVIPLREGRLFLNVAAVIEHEHGSTQHVAAVPIQASKASNPQGESEDASDATN